MSADISTDSLWASAPAGTRTFDAPAEFPEAVRRYLTHAIAPGTRLATAVRLQMHGEIKLGTWRPFRAEEVIVRDGAMVWRARTRLFGLPVSGSDRLIDGRAAMRWKMLGLVPLMVASGPDITRSAAGRVAAESTWLPSMLCDPSVEWTATNRSLAIAAVPLCGERTQLHLSIGSSGALERIELQRWGQLDGETFHYASFGGGIEEERSFGGYTIPVRLRVGWYVGTDRFESDGEFFRVTVDDATFR